MIKSIFSVAFATALTATIALGQTSTSSTTATTGRSVAGRGAVFFEVIPRDAPGRAGLAARIGFCLDAARRAAVRDDFDVPRLAPAEAFLLLFF